MERAGSRGLSRHPFGYSCCYSAWHGSSAENGGRRKKGEGEKAGGYTFIKNLATPLKIVGITALFILAFNRAGYLVTSTLYLFILLLWVSRYRVVVSAALAVAIGVGSWYFFAKILAVQLPQGFLSF